MGNVKRYYIENEKYFAVKQKHLTIILILLILLVATYIITILKVKEEIESREWQIYYLLDDKAQGEEYDRR